MVYKAEECRKRGVTAGGAANGTIYTPAFRQTLSCIEPHGRTSHLMSHANSWATWILAPKEVVFGVENPTFPH